MSVTIETDHVQVPFKTKSGIQVEVDEGMLEILTLLRDLGVETYYSCEGSKRTEEHMGRDSYVLASGRDMTKLLAKIVWHRKRGHYTGPSASLVDGYLGGVKNFEWGKFKAYKHKYLHNDGCERVKTVALRQLTLQGRYGFMYEVEQLYSKRYGWRVGVRWRKTRLTKQVESLLRETKLLLG